MPLSVKREGAACDIADVLVIASCTDGIAVGNVDAQSVHCMSIEPSALGYDNLLSRSWSNYRSRLDPH